MSIEAMIFAIVFFLVVPAILVLSACMISSQVSREEEADELRRRLAADEKSKSKAAG